MGLELSGYVPAPNTLLYSPLYNPTELPEGLFVVLALQRSVPQQDELDTSGSVLNRPSHASLVDLGKDVVDVLDRSPSQRGELDSCRILTIGLLDNKASSVLLKHSTGDQDIVEQLPGKTFVFALELLGHH